MKKLLMSCLLAGTLLLATLCPLAGSATGSPQDPVWEDWGYGSLEEFLEGMDMTEEEYYDFEKEIREWEAWEADYEARHEADRAAALEELGGTPGATNVMYNGEFVKFGDAAPEIVGNSAFVPAKPFFEALGATVDFQASAGTITAAFPNKNVSLALGDDAMSIVEDGFMRGYALAIAPYAKDGVSYVPVRAVAEGLGLEVFWDGLYRSVIIIDTNRIVAEIDKDLTILNSLLKMPLSALPTGGGAYEAVLDLLVSVTVFNSLDGDTTGRMGANLTVLTEGQNFSLTGEADLTELAQLILASEAGFVLDDEYAEAMEERFGMLGQKIPVDIIYNRDKDTAYVKSPILGELQEGIPADAWLAVSGSSGLLGGLDLESIVAGMDLGGFPGDVSIGAAIGAGSVGAYVVRENLYGAHRDSIYAYSELVESAGLARALLGDDRFVIENGDYVLKLSLDDIRAVSPEFDEYGYYAYRFPTEFALKITARTSGNEITGLFGSLVYRMDSYGNTTRYSAEFGISAGKLKLSFEIHEKNAQAVLVELDLAVAESARAVPEGPPAGATIIELEDLYEALWEHDYDPVIHL